MTNRGLVRPKVLDRGGWIANDQRIPTATIDGFIQTAATRLSMEDDWWWLRTTSTIPTVAGQRAYTLATDIQKLKQISWSGNEVVLIQPEKTIPFELMRGAPRFFYMSGDNILSLYPLPDSVITLSYMYYAMEVTIINDSTTLRLPDRFEDILVCMTAIYVARRLNDKDKENEFKEELAFWMASAKESNVRAQGSITPYRRTDWVNW